MSSSSSDSLDVIEEVHEDILEISLADIEAGQMTGNRLSEEDMDHRMLGNAGQAKRPNIKR